MSNSRIALAVSLIVILAAGLTARSSSEFVLGEHDGPQVARTSNPKYDDCVFERQQRELRCLEDVCDRYNPPVYQACMEMCHRQYLEAVDKECGSIPIVGDETPPPDPGPQ